MTTPAATTWNHPLAAIPDKAISSQLFPTVSNNDGNTTNGTDKKPHSSSTTALVADTTTTSSQEVKEEHAEHEPHDRATPRSSLKSKNRKTKRSGKWTVR
jgi:hypothetical protein